MRFNRMLRSVGFGGGLGLTLCLWIGGAGAARAQATPSPGQPEEAAPARPFTPVTASVSPAPDVATEPVVRVFEIRYRDVSEVAILVQPALSPSVMTVNRRTRTITVVDSPEVVRKVAEFIDQFDVPPHAVVVRIVLERAERASTPAAGGELTLGASAFQDPRAWRYVPLAETALEVFERGRARQTFGPDGAFEIHVHLESVDAERGVIRFEEVALTRLVVPSAAGAESPVRREILSAGLDLQDRVGKVVMAARDETAEEALVMRVIGLIRHAEPASGAR